MPPHRVLIAGGGVAALEAAVALRALGGGSVSPTLLCPADDFSFRAQQVAEPFGGTPPLRLPLADVLAELEVPHVRDAVARVDPAERAVHTAGGGVAAYDSLLVAVGGTPFPAYAHGVCFDRPGAPEPFEDLLDDVTAGLVGDVAFVVPDATGWTLPAYDLALLMRGWARRNGHGVRIRVVTPESAPLEAFGGRASAVASGVLERAEVEVVAGAEPVVVSDVALVARGRWITADRLVSLPRLAGPRLPGLPADPHGFVVVDPDGSVPGCPGVWAAGDGAAHATKQGGLAAQQADLAVAAILEGAGIPAPRDLGPPMLRGVLATPEGPLFLESGAPYGEGRRLSRASFVPLWDPPGKVVARWLGPHLDGLVSRRLRAFAA